MKGTIQKSGASYIVRYPDPESEGGRAQIRRPNLEEAEKLLNALRYHDDLGILNLDDYRSPKGRHFDVLADKWCREWVKENVKPKTWQAYEMNMARMKDFWGEKNVKTFKTRDIQEFLDSLTGLGNKSKSTWAATLKSFFRWCRKQGILHATDVPEFPEIKFKLKTRKTVTKEVQGQILDELRRQTYERNPKIHLGTKWLATYVCLRPGDLRRVRECDIDRRNRVVHIRDPKASEGYTLPLTTHDLETLLRIQPGAPQEPFFRHPDGKQFSEGYLYVCWKKACAALDIHDVDLYGGTRHSSVRAMRHTLSPERIRDATMHRTNEAFERYYWMDLEDLRAIYEANEGVSSDRTDGRCTKSVPRI